MKVLRIVLGGFFLAAGLFKFTLFGIPNFARFLHAAGIPFPLPNAALVACLETLGGLILLAAQFRDDCLRLSRWVALLLAIDMLVAIATVGLRTQLGHPILLDGHPIAAEPYRLALEIACLIGLLVIAVRRPQPPR